MSGKPDKKHVMIRLPVRAEGEAVEVPQETVERIVRSAIVAELTKRPEAIDAIVRSVMSQTRDNYSRKTVFEEVYEKMVAETLKTCFAEWIESKREAIRAALQKRLDSDKTGLVDTVVNKITDSLGSAFSVSISLKVQ